MSAELHLVTRCDDCGGSGRADNNPPSDLACAYCDGIGTSVEVLDPERVLNGHLTDGDGLPTSPYFLTVADIVDALIAGRQ